MVTGMDFLVRQLEWITQMGNLDGNLGWVTGIEHCISDYYCTADI